MSVVIVVVFPLVNAFPPTVNDSVYPVDAVAATYILVFFNT